MVHMVCSNVLNLHLNPAKQPVYAKPIYAKRLNCKTCYNARERTQRAKREEKNASKKVRRTRFIVWE